MACGRADSAGDTGPSSTPGEGQEVANADALDDAASVLTAPSASSTDASYPDAASATTISGESPPDAAARECPGARAGGFCGALSIWARDPRTGACCAYGNLCASPENWPAFMSLEECQNSCRCAAFQPPDSLDPLVLAEPAFRTERISLACGCAIKGCPPTLEVTGMTLCNSDLRPNVVRTRGCGRVEVRYSTGFIEGDAVFDESSGALIGTSSFSDTASLPCQTFGWVAGQGFECADVQACQVCGQSFGEPLPRCE